MTLLEVAAERLFGLVLIGGVSLAVVIYIIRKQLRNRQNDPVKVIGLWVLSFVAFFGIAYSAVAAQEGFALILVLLVAVLIAVLLGLAWTPTIVNTLVSPLTTALSGDDTVAYEGPAYGQALAKRKRGQYEDAVEAVEAQLEQYPGDFDGLMLKASIQAENLDDLPAAVATIQAKRPPRISTSRIGTWSRSLRRRMISLGRLKYQGPSRLIRFRPMRPSYKRASAGSRCTPTQSITGRNWRRCISGT